MNQSSSQSSYIIDSRAVHQYRHSDIDLGKLRQDFSHGDKASGNRAIGNSKRIPASSKVSEKADRKNGHRKSSQISVKASKLIRRGSSGSSIRSFKRSNRRSSKSSAATESSFPVASKPRSSLQAIDSFRAADSWLVRRRNTPRGAEGRRVRRQCSANKVIGVVLFFVTYLVF